MEKNQFFLKKVNMNYSIDHNLVCPICQRDISGVPLERFSLSNIRRFMLELLRADGFEIRKIRKDKNKLYAK